MIGRTLAHFRIIDKVGEGGMGVVWRAIDTTLDREVAIKVLPEAFAADAERLARFDREAKMLASLNHPGIATIHGLHQVKGIRFLAMELVPGADLSHRLAAGPMPMDEAIGIACKVAEALEAAHEHGVVHRDLKPANIQLAPDGRVKILDFGLAKAMLEDSSGSGAVSMSPTLTTPATRAGMILGTAAYMSPEQAKGKSVDRRADIWAFGCVLYEMLAGRRPFVGDGISEVMAAVIMAPIDLGLLPPSVPARVRALVRRCLEKDPRRRLRDIGEARFILEETLAGAADETGTTMGGGSAEGTVAAMAARASRSIRRIAIAAVAAAVLAAAGTFALTRMLAPRAPDRPVRRFDLPASGPFRSGVMGALVGISPDGRNIAYFDGAKLLIRNLAQIEPVEIATPGEPVFIFWSPDSAWLGYAANGKLWKAPAGGGQSVLIADIGSNLSGGSGASWGPDGRIVLTSGDSGLLQTSALGGDLKEIIEIDPDKESDLHTPSWLPDGSGVIFAAHKVGGRPDLLALFADGRRKDLLKIDGQDIWHPVYSPTGHILYRRQPSNGGIWALPFSLERHETTGDPFLVAPDGDVPSVSADGTLVHVKGTTSRLTQLVWMDRTGKALGSIGPPQEQWPFPELSPDGQLLSVSGKEHDVGDIWIHDVARGTRTRLSVPNTAYSGGSWNPGGNALVYTEGTSAPFHLKIKSSDGTGEAKEIGDGWGAAWSRDGRYVLFSQLTKDNGWDLWYLDTRGEGKPAPLVQAAGGQLWPRLSPDGGYFAYSSSESGAQEIYIKRFPSAEGKWQVSVSGGFWPRWSRAGDRLYYVNGETIYEVDVATKPALRLGTPRPVLTRKPLGWSLIFGWPPGFEVSADGRRFIVAEAVGGDKRSSGILVVENWSGEFARQE
jgi:serine/threonine-protein kinase